MSNKVPQIRFNDYSDAWVQRKLSDVMTFLNGRAYKQPELLDSGKYPVLRVGNFGTNEQWYYSDLELDEKFYANDGDLLYTWATAFGPHIWRGDKVIYHYHIWKLDLSETIHRDFAVQVLEYDKAKLLANTNGSTMIHVTKGEMEKKEIAIPSTEEQDKIGDLFNKLDSLIAVNQRKLDLLKEQKKGYLQKMFPKNGSKVPELRFAGFADDWEERKLSDLFIKGGSGGTPKSTNKAFYDGDIPFLGISDITKSNGFINNTEKHISSDGLNSSAAWIVSKGAISLAMYASVGKLAILNIDAATSQAFYNMIFDDYDLRDLVYQRLNKANELSEWNKLISTGTQSNLNADKVKNFQMYLPKNHDEIKLISTFFKQIDNTIALHQRKLDLLKEQKKGFLQKMFV